MGDCSVPSASGILAEYVVALFAQADHLTFRPQVVVPSQSKQILSTPLKQFVSLIKVCLHDFGFLLSFSSIYVQTPDGLTDGIDKYPVYSVLPSSTLLYTMQKLIATNAHRVFVTDEPQTHSPSLSPSPSSGLCGIVSIVDGTSSHFQALPSLTREF